MARIKPQALQQQSKRKKGPSRISLTTIIMTTVIVVLIVFFVYASYRHWTQKVKNAYREQAISYRGGNFFFYMEEFLGTRFSGVNNAVRKKRSQTSRRPCSDSQSYAESQDRSPLSLTPPSDDVSKVSSDENAGGNANSKRKDFNLNQHVSGVSPAVGVEVEKNP